ncbi:type II toxin-antitoxin system VapC family toxin [Candidatus Woesearchaeota archaeon]|nr:type II toxin-antitoxin system VapC family toxin [Candidatus Woesearchaeota archaeon]
MIWIDASVWLEIGLGQEKAAACAAFLEGVGETDVFTSDFDTYSVVLTLLKHKRAEQVPTFFGVLAGFPKLTVVRPTPSVVVEAAQSMALRRLTFDDCLSYCCMKRLGIKRIATLDQDFKKVDLEYVI